MIPLSVFGPFWKSLSQSVTKSLFEVWQVLQSVTEVYDKVRQVLKSEAVIAKWEVTIFNDLSDANNKEILQILS